TRLVAGPTDGAHDAPLEHSLRGHQPPAVRRRGRLPDRLPRAPARHTAHPGRRLDPPVRSAAAGPSAAGRRRPLTPRRPLPRSSRNSVLTCINSASLQVMGLTVGGERPPGPCEPTDRELSTIPPSPATVRT